MRMEAAEDVAAFGIIVQCAQYSVPQSRWT